MFTDHVPCGSPSSWSRGRPHGCSYPSALDPRMITATDQPCAAPKLVAKSDLLVCLASDAALW